MEVTLLRLVNRYKSIKPWQITENEINIDFIWIEILTIVIDNYNYIDTSMPNFKTYIDSHVREMYIQTKTPECRPLIFQWLRLTKKSAF